MDNPSADILPVFSKKLYDLITNPLTALVHQPETKSSSEKSIRCDEATFPQSTHRIGPFLRDTS